MMTNWKTPVYLFTSIKVAQNVRIPIEAATIFQSASKSPAATKLIRRHHVVIGGSLRIQQGKCNIIFWLCKMQNGIFITAFLFLNYLYNKMKGIVIILVCAFHCLGAQVLKKDSIDYLF